MIKDIEEPVIVLHNNVVPKSKTLGASTRTKDGKYLVLINEETKEQTEASSEEEANRIKNFYLYD